MQIVFSFFFLFFIGTEGQGILQIIMPRCFFFFLSLFTTDTCTNAGQSYWLTHCTKHQHRYNLTSSIFKHSLLCLHTFKNTTQALKTFFLLANRLQMLYIVLLISSISPKHVLIAVSDFGAWEEQNWNLTIPVQFSPPHPGKGEIPTLRTA